MSGLNDAAKEAREHAGVCTDPSCHRLALALESALIAQARESVSELREEPDLTGIPSPEQAGHPSNIWVERGGTEN